MQTRVLGNHNSLPIRAAVDSDYVGASVVLSTFPFALEFGRVLRHPVESQNRATRQETPRR
jgi:hypothetical protein